MSRFRVSMTFVVLTIALFAVSAFGQAKTVENPAVVSAVAPIFPAVAIPLRLEGPYQVDVEIDRTGKVVSSKAVEGTHKLMRKTIEMAADRWQFEADESAVKRRRVRLTFTFRYTPKASSADSTPIYYPPYKIEVRDNTVIMTTPSH